MSETHIVPARRGLALKLSAGKSFKIVNTYGSQVIDFWAFNADDLSEFMSMEHSRPQIGRIMPKVGDAMRTNQRRPILTLLEDSSPGIHDTLVAACDIHRYRALGVKDYHASCTDNFHDALKAIGVTAPEQPCPWNVWMNIPVAPDGAIAFCPPVSKPGDHVLLRAEMNVVLVFSACPMDITPVNGLDRTVRDCAVEVL